MKNKGFTLVEMLGVITVLAIISVIVVPLIVNQVRGRKNQINKALLDSINASAMNYISKNKNIYNGQINSCIKISNLVDSNELDSSIYDYTELGFDMKEAYFFTGSVDNEAAITDSCTPIYNTYDNGTVIYFNPEIETICNNPVSTTGVKTGCMKWYIFNDINTSPTVNIILDHNTTSFTGAGSSLSTALNNDISSWFIDVKTSARLITANEIAQITNASTTLEWASDRVYTSSTPTIGTNISSFYFDGAYGVDSTWKTPVATVLGASKYAWLYDRTYCVGCNIQDSNSSLEGYWTSTAVAGVSGYTWKVDKTGYLVPADDSETTKNGIRPVITIPKSIIK